MIKACTETGEKMPALAKRVVLEWYPEGTMDRKMPKSYKWGCPVCKNVYEMQTHAQACCKEKKENPPDWLNNIEIALPVGTYDEDGYHPLDFTRTGLQHMAKKILAGEVSDETFQIMAANTEKIVGMPVKYMGAPPGQEFADTLNKRIRQEMVIRLGEDLTNLVDEIIDKCNKLETEGTDPDKWEGWGPWKEKLKQLNEDSDVRLVGILKSRKFTQSPEQKTLDVYC